MPKGKTKRRSRRGLWLRILGAVLGLALIAEILWWPDVASLARKNPGRTAFMTRHLEGETKKGKKARFQWTWVRSSEISRHLKHAILVSEDIGFFGHHGFAPEEMKKAIAEGLEEGEVPRGASTITQQLAKNLWLSPSRNPLRKIEEAILTWQLERDLDKARILEIYLNVVEFGPGLYGAEAASRAYFGKRAAELTKEEAASLAVVLPRPRTWRPGHTSPHYAKKVRLVMERMERSEAILRHL